MKMLITSTAIALAFASPAFADAHGPSAFVPTISEQARYASELIGARIYVSEVEVAEDRTGLDKNWEHVGEISDIIVGRDGDVLAVTTDIGGFLGMGEKTVALGMDKLRFVSDGPERGEYFVVVQSSREMLESAPEFEWNRTDAAMGTAESDTSSKLAIGSQARDYRFNPPTIQREGYETVAIDKLSTDDLNGAPVYDANDEWIGEVYSVLLNDDGKLGDAIVDVGGFLGIGEKRVAVSFDEVTLQHARDGSDVRIYVDATKEQLEQLPEVDM